MTAHVPTVVYVPHELALVGDGRTWRLVPVAPSWWYDEREPETAAFQESDRLGGLAHLTCTPAPVKPSRRRRHRWRRSVAT